MKRAVLFLVVLLVLTSPPAWSFVGHGVIDFSLDYSDLVFSPDGSQVVVTNRSAQAREEFYIIIYATNFRDAQVYRHRFYVDYIPGYGSVIANMPPYLSRDSIFNIKFEIRKPKEMDVRVR